MMRSIIVAIALAICNCQTAQSQQDGRYWITGSRESAGQWIITVRNGNVTISAMTNVLEVPTGGTPPPPPPPPEPSSLAGKVAGWSAEVADPERAEQLAVGYATVADQIAQNKFSSKAQVVKAQEAVNKMLIGDNNVGKWQTFLDKLSVELSDLERNGKMNTVADMEDEWREIAKGLKVTGGESINWDKLIELILMIIKLITSLQP